MGSLDGAVVVITGSSRGIGRAIAEELGQSGAKVIVNYHQSREAAEDVVALLKQSGSESVAILGRCIRSCTGRQAQRGNFSEIW